MPKMFKRFKGLFLFVMLLSVSARVFTGASEAQVNFTSLILDQNLITHNNASEHNLLHNSVIKSLDGASTIPDKHRTYATYKKYITPDKSLSVELAVTQRKAVRASAVRFINLNRVHRSIYLPVSNSPPAVVSARSHTHTTTTDIPVVTENRFGTIAINYSAGGLGSFQL
jgi:hypothetical protein